MLQVILNLNKIYLIIIKIKQIFAIVYAQEYLRLWFRKKLCTLLHTKQIT